MVDDRPDSPEQDDMPAVETSEDLISATTETFDWRARAATTLAQDVPAAYPGGPSHKAGAPVVVVTIGPGLHRLPLSFVTPSSPALAVSAAIKSASAAHELRKKLLFDIHSGPTGSTEGVSDGTTVELFDFFEQAFVAIVFSYQSIEAFANEEVQRLVQRPYKVSFRGDLEELDADAIERWLPTEQKLVDVIPAFMRVRPPKKAKWWASFKSLTRLRNDTIHLKAGRAYPRALIGVPPPSIFHELLATKSLMVFPNTAIAAMRHFHEGRDLPGWLTSAEAIIAAEPLAP